MNWEDFAGKVSSVTETDEGIEIRTTHGEGEQAISAKRIDNPDLDDAVNRLAAAKERVKQETRIMRQLEQAVVREGIKNGSPYNDDFVLVLTKKNEIALQRSRVFRMNADSAEVPEEISSVSVMKPAVVEIDAPYVEGLDERAKQYVADNFEEKTREWRVKVLVSETNETKEDG